MLRPLVVLVALLAAPALPAVAEWNSWLPGASATENGPGTKAWWKKHKKKATFVPGEGYRVEGQEGYFDGDGRPIATPVDELGIKLTTDTDEGGGLLPELDPKVTYNKMKDAMGYGPSEEVSRQALEEGVRLFEAKEYDQAADAFATAASRWPDTQVEALALFNRGESHYFNEKYKDASDSYIALLDKHPNTPRLNDAVERLWSIAQYWEKQYFSTESHAPMQMNLTERSRPTFDTIGHAVRLYEAIRLNDPTGPRAADAIMATAGVHFRRQRYHDADYHYGLLRSEYPRSEHLFEAHLLGLQSKLQKYQGADYDGTPLVEAKALEERVRVNFSGRLSAEEKDRLTQTRAEMIAMIEQRDMRMADYYLNISQNGPAKVYLEKIVTEHSGSPVAEEAKKKLEAIAGKPDMPAEPLPWLVDVFPKNQERAAIDDIAEVATVRPAGDSLSPDADVTRVAQQPEGEDAEATSTR